MPPKKPTPKPEGDAGVYPRWSTRKGKYVWDAVAMVDGRRREARGFETKQLARAWRDDMRVGMRKGQVGNAPAKLTVAGLVEDYWLPAKRAELRSERSPATYKFWTNIIIADLGKLQVRKLTKLDVMEWKTKLIRDGYAPATARAIFGCMRSVMKWAEEAELVYRNVTTATTRPRAEARNPQVLEIEKVKELLAAAEAQSPVAGMMAWLACVLGLRFSEVVGLTWSEIDLHDGALRLRKRDDRPIKTKAGQRPVKLGPEGIEKLRAYRMEQMAGYVERGVPPPSLVCLRPDGLPIKSTWWWWRWNAIREAAGIADLHYHDLRHVQGTLLARLGVHPKVAQERLGHASSATTMDIYTHTMADGQTEAAQGLEDLLR